MNQKYNKCIILFCLESVHQLGMAFVNDGLQEPKNLKHLMKPLKKLKEPVKCRRNVQKPEATC